MRNHRTNAGSVGDYKAEGVYILKEIEATKQHYRNAFTAADRYYAAKYDSTIKRLIAGIKFSGLWLENIFWGHGEKMGRPIIFVASYILLASVFSTLKTLDPSITISTAMVVGFDYMEYYSKFLLGIENQNKLDRPLFLDYITSIMRVLLIGAIASIFFRRISHR
ncbi:MAG: hypothetical protein MJA83_17605 [Gammaproteobacteria bacterium]|nr:hypothetical protein [Gammaproteobacteria bacterium]